LTLPFAPSFLFVTLQTDTAKLYHKTRKPVKQGARRGRVALGGIFMRASGARVAARAKTGKGRQSGGRRFFRPAR